jgi:two-component system response regulator DesR
VTGDAKLTARELEVLELANDGLPDEEIADRLGIARSTVASLLVSSLTKLDARTRVEAAAELTRISEATARRTATRQPRSGGLQ